MSASITHDGQSSRRYGLLRGDAFRWFCRLFLGLWLLLECVPLIYVIGVSLSRPEDVGNTILFVLPPRPTLASYLQIFQYFDANLVSLWRLLANNVIYTVGILVGSLVLVSFAAFAFATMDFRGRRLLFYVILLQLVVPLQIILVPLFVTVRVLGFSGSYLAVILPAMAGIALPLVILTAFFRRLPSELIDAARVDGCNSVRIFWHVAIPLSRPAYAALIIFGFLDGWNLYNLPLVMVNNSDLQNLPVALAGLLRNHSSTTPWPLLATAIIIASLPATVVFIAFQRNLVEGLREGIAKG